MEWGQKNGRKERKEKTHTHTNEQTPIVQHNPIPFQTMPASANHLGYTLVKGVSKAHMGNCTTLEKGKWSDAFGAVDDLVWHDKVSRLDLLP
jgi:hypothetical protein